MTFNDVATIRSETTVGWARSDNGNASTDEPISRSTHTKENLSLNRERKIYIPTARELADSFLLPNLPTQNNDLLAEQSQPEVRLLRVKSAHGNSQARKTLDTEPSRKRAMSVLIPPRLIHGPSVSDEVLSQTRAFKDDPLTLKGGNFDLPDIESDEEGECNSDGSSDEGGYTSHSSDYYGHPGETDHHHDSDGEASMTLDSDDSDRETVYSDSDVSVSDSSSHISTELVSSVNSDPGTEEILEELIPFPQNIQRAVRFTMPAHNENLPIKKSTAIRNRALTPRPAYHPYDRNNSESSNSSGDQTYATIGGKSSHVGGQYSDDGNFLLLAAKDYVKGTRTGIRTVSRQVKSEDIQSRARSI